MNLRAIARKDLIETRYYRLGFSYTVLGLLTVCQLWMINSFNYHTRANKGRGLYSENIFWPMIAANNRERLVTKNYFPSNNVPM